jgi:hypothetical protein
MFKNITLSVEESLIRRARERAHAKGTTLNDEFRQWLEKYVERPETAEALQEFMGRFEYVQPGRTFRREEMNAR